MKLHCNRQQPYKRRRQIEEKKPNILKKIEDEHAEVDSKLENLKIGLETWRESSDFVLWKIEFVWQMREFKNYLLHHFEFEEDSGFFEYFPVEGVKKGTSGNKVKLEHNRLIKDLDKILRRLKRTKETNLSKLKDVEISILKLIKDIYKHEEMEGHVIRSIGNNQKH